MKTLLRLSYQHAATIFLVWFAIIFVLCATPGEYIPSNNWLDLLSIDKLVHASMFFILYLSAALFLLRKKSSKTFFLIVLLFCLAYGLSLEMMQATLFRNRSADYKDMIANSLGCFAAFACLPALRKHLTTAV